MFPNLLLIISAYLIGSIPAGYWLVWFWRGVDVRQSGSGNIGATNVARAAGKTAGIITLVLDIFKGWLPVYLAVHFFQFNYYWAFGAGVAAILGHNYTIFLNFKGGKGVATSAGVFLALTPLALLFSLLIFLLIVAASKYVSLGSIIAAISLPVFGFFFRYPTELIVFICLAAALIIFKHRPNIKRLIQGKENRLNWGKK
ncbi:MAG: glycerol-3-phosphate 1-O-acyltransferase PlsY [Elusimicrobiota bacterium]